MKLLNLVNATNQSVLTGGTVNLGSVIHRVCGGTFDFSNSNTILLYKVFVFLLLACLANIFIESIRGRPALI